MDEKDWSILLTINRERTITKAAEKLHISQPALTYRLQQIENKFSTKIFIRGKKGIKLTTEGEYLVTYAKEMTINLRNLKDRLLDLSTNISGELRIGVSSNYAHYRLPLILKDFINKYPLIQINVKTGWSSDILNSFLAEEIHIGIIRGNYDWDGPKVLMEDDPMCIISKNNINFNNLPYLSRIDYKTDFDLKQLIERWWQSWFSESPLITMEVDKLETCKKMVVHGLGYGVIPRYILHNKDEEQSLYLQNLTTPDNQVIYRKLWMFYRSNELTLRVVKAFVDFIKDRHNIS